MLGPFATVSRFTLSFTRGRYCRHCRTPPAHRCPRRRQRRQRQRVTDGTAMAPWNGPNERKQKHSRIRLTLSNSSSCSSPSVKTVRSINRCSCWSKRVKSSNQTVNSPTRSETPSTSASDSCR